MLHQSENSRRLNIESLFVRDEQALIESSRGFGDVCFIRLPTHQNHLSQTRLTHAGAIVSKVGQLLSHNATLIIFGEVLDLVHIHATVSTSLRYQLWIAIKRETALVSTSQNQLPHQHVGALVYTKYDKQLQHTKTRLEYTYCPVCNKTTKDYGGKKHTYNAYGTLISDVWRDISINPSGDITPVIERFADLFGLPHYQALRVYDVSRCLTEYAVQPKPAYPNPTVPEALSSKLLHGDCLNQLRTLPDNSIDFAFVDPPYNLKKEYQGYADNMSIGDYFRWCDEWISEIARVLCPGGTLALLNIPLWSIRHFLQLETVLTYQNWLVWDALSFPVRLIMPAHYTILCFSKGEARPLPGLTASSENLEILTGYASLAIDASESLSVLKDGFCLRAQCVSDRARHALKDRDVLSDIWSDIHRLKHNSRRVDHPCQLPPPLMYRLIQLFTQPGEIVLDCFNGAGTTTLTAHQLGRRYIGVELEQRYYQMGLERHNEIEHGLDPFRKVNRELTAKNSPVERLKKQRYEIPKKTLQLEVKRVAQQLGHIPNHAEMVEHGKYPIRYYDEYFISWGEVCAAARTTGMKETREDSVEPSLKSSQPRLF